MTGIGSVLLTWFVVADTWLTLTAHAEPSAVVILALVVAVGVLAIGATVAVRVVLRAIGRTTSAPRQADGTTLVEPAPRMPLPLRPVGARGARAPSRAAIPVSSIV